MKYRCKDCGGIAIWPPGGTTDFHVCASVISNDPVSGTTVDIGTVVDTQLAGDTSCGTFATTTPFT
jgi:hypothetical protein